MNDNTQNKRIVIIVTILVLVVLIGFGIGYSKHNEYGTTNNGVVENDGDEINTASQNNTGSQNQTQTTKSNPVTPVGMKTYKSAQYGYQIAYPSNWITQINIVTGTAGIDFCSPEFFTTGITPVRCKDNPNTTNPRMAEPGTLAPIQLLTYGLGSVNIKPGAGRIILGSNSQYTFVLYLANTKYQSIFSQMVTSFKISI